MTDNTKETKTKTTQKPLTLKKSTGGSGVVRQQFSHGRSKAVLVEKRGTRKRIGADPKPKEQKIDLGPGKKETPKAEETQAQAAAADMALGGLSEAEREARLQALSEAKIREEEEKKRKEQEAKEEAERLKKMEEEARLAAEEAALKAEKGIVEKPKDKPRDDKKSVGPKAVEAEDAKDKELRNANRKKLSIDKPVKRDPAERRQPKLTLQNALDMDDERSVSVAAYRRKIQKEKRKAQAEAGEKISREVTIPETITIADLANRMSERAVDVIKFLMKQGAMHKAGDVIDADTAQLIAEEMGHTVKRVSESDVEEGLFDTVDKDETLKPRAPIVTVMGHVDHGKTSLLDALRTTNVVSGEAGGITQHIGAYQVTRDNGEKVTFIDTPGHEAFTAMRSRGAGITDLVVLVVAADDGVMPQTIEAISHAKSAEVPMIVAINKIDKPEADPNRVRTELLQHEVVTENMGGDILEVEVSALKRTNLDTLIENIGLQSELLELKANPDRAGEGTVVEARLDKGRGPVATILVQKGTVRQGDIVVAGAAWGKVRALIDDQGQTVESAGPSMPVEVLGFDSTPDAGDRLAVVQNEARAREIAEFRMRKKREKQQALMSGKRGSLTDMLKTLKDQADVQELPIIIKGDVQGSVEAIIGSLEKISTDEVRARVIHAGVGGITESDVTLANASEAAILGFNVRANKQARDAAEADGVNVRYYNIIYDLVNDIKDTLSGLLAPEIREEMLGNAEVLEVFGVSKIGKVAGCLVTEGKVERGAGVRLIRDDVVIHEGSLSTLKRFKDDAKEVTSGMECGMSFENYSDIKKGDVIECYRVVEEARSL